MYYYIYSIHSYKNIPNQLDTTEIKSGYFIFFAKSEKKFFYLYSIRKGTSITPYPWRRGVDIDKIQGLSFLKDLSPGHFRRIRRKDFKLIVNALKKKQRKNEESITIHWSEDQMMIQLEKAQTEKIFHVELSTDIYRKLFEAKDIIYRSHAKESREEELSFSYTKYNALRIRKILFDDNPHLSNLFRRLKNFSMIRVSSFQYTRLIALKYILFENQNIIHMLPKPIEYFNKIRVFHKKNKDKRIARVLVFTNMNGKPLAHLNSAIDFWSRGEPGFIWKHIYGKLSMEHLKKITRNHYDMIIYRGHSKILQRRITWPLIEGDVPMDQFFSENIIPHYIHLACSEMNETQELKNYPFDLGLMPISYLPDMDYSGFIKNILHYLKNSHSVLDSMRKSLDEDPQLFNLFAIWQ